MVSLGPDNSHSAITYFDNTRIQVMDIVEPKREGKSLRRCSRSSLSRSLSKPDGGRKRTVDVDPTLRSDLEKLLDPATRGDPETPLRQRDKVLRAWLTGRRPCVAPHLRLGARRDSPKR
jgi:hypothetical protein